MARLSRLFLYAINLPVVLADDLSDFSNDLASDVGPLLALFGESITCQYLSESTTFLDYFIFAMAPIGIITAVISTIRVCGHSTLRALVGRSQEGDGAVEAELCTSTSRDVCELFNKGGITRVLGRPHVLEIIHTPGEKEELHLFRNYLENGHDPDSSEWTRVHSSKSQDRSTTLSSHSSVFAPKPNLSLNVGIKKQPDWLFYAIAIIGFVFQAGVLVLAGTGVWHLGWNVEDDQTLAERDYAPGIYIAGTITMCAGMWCCAALIGQTTQEVRYKRKKTYDEATGKLNAPKSRLIYLQPGPQVIGDQSFDPFAHFENTEKDPLRVWTSSKKDFDKKFELYTFFAVAAVLLGYIAQFIGLRGLKAWVAITQLGITFVMSILRGLLRMQRLGRDGNKLAQMPDLSAGHELDWLSLEIASQSSEKKLAWCLTGQHSPALEGDDSTNNEQTQPSSSGTETSSNDEKVTKTSPNSNVQAVTSANPGTSGGSQVDGWKLLSIRERLSHLTGHSPFKTLEKTAYQEWEDEHVKIREMSRNLSASICQAAASLLQKRSQKGNIKLCIRANLHSSDSATPCGELIEVTLKPPSDLTQTAWSIDSAKIEAILGLWTWSLLRDEHFKDRDESGNTISLAESVEIMRVVSSGPDNDNWHQNHDRQGEMSLWLGPESVKLLQTTLYVIGNENGGLMETWHKPRDKKSWRKSHSTEISGIQRRFCGWDLVHESLNPPAVDSTSTTTATTSTRPEPKKIRVQTVRTKKPLLEVCAQELFVVLINSLISLVEVEKTTVMERRGNIGLDNPTVSTLTEAFVENDLGSSSEALWCLVPALGKKVCPDPDDLISALVKASETYRREGEWDRAEILLRWACEYCSSVYHTGGDMAGKISRFRKALVATAEFYRWSLRRHSEDERKRFGMEGIRWLATRYTKSHSLGSIALFNPEGKQQIQDIEEILQRYQEVVRKIRVHTPQLDTAPGTDQSDEEPQQHPLIKALEDQDRTETLYLLCVTTGDIRSKVLQPALPLAARNNWTEVISVVLEMRASLESRDNSGRTAISHCAEVGNESLLRYFIELGAFLEPADEEGRTPLHWAATAGQVACAEILFQAGHVDYNRKATSGATPLHLAAEGKHEAFVRLLLDKKAVVETMSLDGFTPLHIAAGVGSNSITDLLLKNGAGIGTEDYIFEAPIFKAVTNNHKKTVELLLDRGANIDAEEALGKTPLMFAVENGHKSIVDLLIGRGADIEVKASSRDTALLMGARKGDESIVEALLRKDIKVNYPTRDPLSEAIQNGHGNVAKLLIDKGADVTWSDGHSRTALWFAVEKGLTDLVPLLLKRGANFMKSARDEPSPYELASSKGLDKVTEMMVEHGATSGWRDERGCTALWLAAATGQNDLVRALVERGADPTVKDYGSSTTAIWQATIRGQTDLVKLMEDSVQGRGQGSEK